MKSQLPGGLALRLATDSRRVTIFVSDTRLMMRHAVAGPLRSDRAITPPVTFIKRSVITVMTIYRHIQA